MNKLHLFTTAFAAAITALPARVAAQNLAVTASGYSGSRLFDSTAGFTITGHAASPTGKIFYLETDSAQKVSTKLYRRSPSDNYATATLLHDLGAPVFGSFVRMLGKNVYFSESSGGGIFRIARNGTRFDKLGTVNGNYDLASNGNSLFLSADQSFTNNEVLKLELSKGAPGDRRISGMRSVLNTEGDFSGPITFDGTGSLFYGAAQAAKNGIYRYGAEQVAAGGLTLDEPHRLVENVGNTSLVYGGDGDLWQDSFSGPLNVIDRRDGTILDVATSAESLGQLDFANDTLFVNVTDFSTSRSALFAVISNPAATAPVPEPSSLATFGGMLALLGFRSPRSTKP